MEKKSKTNSKSVNKKTKKVVKTTTKKTVTAKKPQVKKTTVSKKKPRKKKAFTLIELLAVIIILGVIMLIAIPSVTKYINNSRTTAYVDTAKQIMSSTKTVVNEGELSMYDMDATYYIPSSFIKTENSSRSPYGEFTEAYIGVVYNERGYKYYWISSDTASRGVPVITPLDKLDNKSIQSNVKDVDVRATVETTGIGDRSKIKILGADGIWEEDRYATKFLNEDGTEKVLEPLVVPGNYTLNNNYYYIGKKTYSDWWSYANVPLIDIPEGSTEFVAYYKKTYEANNASYINSSGWIPVTIVNGKFVCGTNAFVGEDGYIPFVTTAGTFSCGTDILNRARLNYESEIIKVNNKLVINHFQEVPSASYYIKLKFRGPNHQDSDWYLAGVYVTPCIEANMEVEVYDEKKKKRLKKKIKDLTYDDLILVWDFDNAEFAWAKPLWIKVLQASDTYHLLKFSDGSELKIVTDHRIFNVEKKMFTAAMTDDTPIGTTTLNSRGELVKLVSKETFVEPCEFCNVITKKHINLFANGILTSWRLNNLYEIEDLKFVKDNRELKKREDFTEVDDDWFDGLRVAESPDTKEKILDDIEYCKRIQM